MKYLPLIIAMLFLYSCKKDKSEPAPIYIKSSFKTLGSDYVTNVFVYPKYTTDNNMLAILMKTTNTCDLVKINPNGAIVWATTLGTESFYNNAIKELDNDIYMIYSSKKVFVVNKNGTIIKEHSLFIMDGHKSGSNIYLINMDNCYKLDMNYNLLDSFPNMHKPSITDPYYYSGLPLLTTHTALFRNDNKIQYFYQDSAKSSLMHIITCNLDNSLIDSNSNFAGYRFLTFKPVGNHVIVGKGLWGSMGVPAFFVHLYKYTNGADMDDFSHYDFSTNYFNGTMSESSDNKIVFACMFLGTDLRVYKSDVAQTNFSYFNIIADSVIKKDIVKNSGNISGIVCEPGTENFYLFTFGTPWNSKPQIIKINGTPEVINF